VGVKTNLVLNKKQFFYKEASLYGKQISLLKPWETYKVTIKMLTCQSSIVIHKFKNQRKDKDKINDIAARLD